MNILGKTPSKHSRSQSQLSEKDENELFEELKTLSIGSLYGKFHKANINVRILWDLDERQLDDCKLNEDEKHLYKDAKKVHLSSTKGDFILEL